MLSAFLNGSLLGLGVAFGFFVGCLVFTATANVLAARIRKSQSDKEENKKVYRSLFEIMKSRGELN